MTRKIEVSMMMARMAAGLAHLRQRQPKLLLSTLLEDLQVHFVEVFLFLKLQQVWVACLRDRFNQVLDVHQQTVNILDSTLSVLFHVFR